MCRAEQPPNPFRSERLRPGVIPFLFAGGVCIDDLIEQLRCNGWRGEIVGPHGTGKSTLVQSLLTELTSRGHRIRYGSYSGGRAQWNESNAESAASRDEQSQPTIVVIDGFEQLSAATRWRWKCWTRMRGLGLLVTTHRSVGLPSLYETNVTLDLASEITRQIAGNDLGGFSASEVAELLHANDGNMRDALFLLYDRFEQRRDR